MKAESRQIPQKLAARLKFVYCLLHRCRSRQIFGVRRIFAQISPNLPETFLCDFCLQIFISWRPFYLFLVWPPKNRSSCVFLQTLGAIFSNQTTLGIIFARIFRDFAQIFKDFARNFDKPKLLWVPLHPLHPRLLHQCFIATPTL